MPSSQYINDVCWFSNLPDPILILKINAWFAETENKQIHQRHFKSYILEVTDENRLLVKNDFVSFDIHSIASSERILLEYVLVMILSLEPEQDLSGDLTIWWANGDNEFKQLQLSLIHRILQTRRFARVAIKGFWNTGGCTLGPEFKKVNEDDDDVYFEHIRSNFS